MFSAKHFFTFQLADIRSGKNKKNTLLKFLITELQRCDPDALMFLEDLKAVPKASDGKSTDPTL